MATLSAEDRLQLQELNARYFYALDGLHTLIPGDPAQNWANTFTADGTFSIVQANGEPIIQIQGTQALIDAFKSFPDIATTRHWINDLLIEPAEQGVKSGCYIIAMNIKDNPATVVRTGVYQDQVVNQSGQWKFQSRTLILDPCSPVS